MKDIIKKLEAAEEGSRELDYKILASIGTHVREKRGRDAKPWWYRKDNNTSHRYNVEYYGRNGAPYYTTSIDAALTLVPEDERNEITGRYDWQVESINCGLTISARVGPESTLSFANSPALALCIAALRARDA